MSGVGLVGLALYSHFFLRERLQLLEWGAVALAGAGTIGLGATGGDDAAASSDAAAGNQPSATRMVGTVAALAVSIVGISLLRQRARQRRGRGAGADRSGAGVYGLQAGACFGLSAASCRTGGWGHCNVPLWAWLCSPLASQSACCCRLGRQAALHASCDSATNAGHPSAHRAGFLLAQRHRLWPLLGLGGSVALSGYGFVLQTVGLKEGNTVVVCTLAAVSAMVSGVAVGLLVRSRGDGIGEQGQGLHCPSSAGLWE